MEEFYSASLSEELILDRFLYRGKGRPRKTDYSPLSVIQKKINLLMSQYGCIITDLSLRFPFKKDKPLTEWNLYGE